MNPATRKTSRAAASSFDEIIVDSFAGGGGASMGIETALGRAVDVAINHDAAAIAMHAANHPHTLHLTEDVWKVNPYLVCGTNWVADGHGRDRETGGRKVGLLWASPDCKHFSRAKGGKPVEKKIRSLAWVVVKWAKAVGPRVIMLENVREFQDWGPLIQAMGTDGQPLLTAHGEPVLIPDKTRKGHTFKRWVASLRSLGYVVEWRPLDAADYGAPTHRRRLFLIARRDGQPIIWPERTHGNVDATAAVGRSKDVDRRGELDASRFTQAGVVGDREASDRDEVESGAARTGAGGQSTGENYRTRALKPYRTAAECIDWTIPCPSIFNRKRPLAEKTMRRIAMGIKRFVLDNPKPFVVNVQHGGEEFRGQATDEPLSTVTAKHGYGVVTPFIARCAHGDESAGGKRWGKSSHSIGEPLPTATASKDYALVSPVLVGMGGSAYAGKPRSADRPMGVVKCDNHAGVMQAFLTRFFGQSVGSDPQQPAPTATADVNKTGVIAATLVQTGYGERDGQSPRAMDIEKPLGTVVAGGCKTGLVSAHITKFYGTSTGSQPDKPMPTTTVGGNHAGLVHAFLIRYFGQGIGQTVDGPKHTSTCRDRDGLVVVYVAGEPHVIVDIGLRMLTPRELARAQGFPDDYVLTGTKSSQVARIGNSVCPVMAEVLVRANCREMAAEKSFTPSKRRKQRNGMYVSATSATSGFKSASAVGGVA